MSIFKFVKNLLETIYETTTTHITVEEAAALLDDFSDDCFGIPEDTAPEDVARIWNELVDERNEEKICDLVKNLFENSYETPTHITVEEAAADLENISRQGWDIPDDIPPEQFSSLWNELVDVQNADE